MVSNSARGMTGSVQNLDFRSASARTHASGSAENKVREWESGLLMLVGMKKLCQWIDCLCVQRTWHVGLLKNCGAVP